MPWPRGGVASLASRQAASNCLLACSPAVGQRLLPVHRQRFLEAEDVNLLPKLCQRQPGSSGQVESLGVGGGRLQGVPAAASP